MRKNAEKKPIKLNHTVQIDSSSALRFKMCAYTQKFNKV